MRESIGRGSTRPRCEASLRSCFRPEVGLLVWLRSRCMHQNDLFARPLEENQQPNCIGGIIERLSVKVLKRLAVTDKHMTQIQLAQ